MAETCLSSDTATMLPAVPNEVAPGSPVVYGEVAKVLAPLLEHVRDACIFVDDEMRVGFLNLVARLDQQSVGIDPNKFPGNSLWDLLAIRAMPALAIQSGRGRVPTHFTTRGPARVLG